jgi:hypothetical protein
MALRQAGGTAVCSGVRWGCWAINNPAEKKTAAGKAAINKRMLGTPHELPVPIYHLWVTKRFKVNNPKDGFAPKSRQIWQYLTASTAKGKMSS